ncbi:MAG: S53 family peptidase [Candidatus Eremiobacteraeota bacterium]|nr:S53 family peptidase [Candidatus Eremiobacteraeota bacterium]
MRFTFASRSSLCALALTAMVAGCSGGGSPLAPAPGSQGAGSAIPSSVATMNAGWHDMGRADAATHVDLAVVLKYHNSAGLEQLVEAQGDESSPSYHHFLSPSQFDQMYGPTTADYALTIGQLQKAGFTVTNTSANRTVVDVSAPAPVAEKFFSTEIHLVRRQDGSIRYENVRAETIPASLVNVVLSVVGLDNAHVLRPQYVVLPAGTPRTGGGTDAQGAPLFGPDGGYGPKVYRISYDFPKGLTGTGRASGVVGDADFLDTDLAGYLSYFHVNRTGPPTQRVLVDGGPPKGISQDSIETTLDVETIVSIDPGTALYVYEAPQEPDLRKFTDLYNRVVTDNKVDTVNTSYSECETALVPSFPKAADAIETQGAALGITFHASTGDYGTTTYGCSSGVTVGTPADTPHNVAIGGTIEQVNHTTGQETTEVGWNDSSGATGGGVSTVFPLPKYQNRIANAIKSGRNIPDVSFDASPYTGESLYFEGGFSGPIGGTSLSSPIFGAGLTVIDQLKNSRAGYFNTNLYATWRANQYVKDTTVYFRDIISGSIPPYNAMKGYDQMSGIGAMQFANFASVLR